MGVSATRGPGDKALKFFNDIPTPCRVIGLGSRCHKIV